MSFLENIGLKKRIYFSITGVTLISFLIIGTATMIYTSQENEKYHRERLSRKERAVQLSLNYFLRNSQADLNTFYTKDFHNKIVELADIHNLELNIFDLDGKWFSSSNFKYFDLGLLPDSLSKSTLGDLKNADGHLLTSRYINNNEFIYSLGYLKNEAGEPLAIINIPYFTSDEQSREETEEFLFALANIYSILLLVGLFLAYILSNSITRNLGIVTKNINSISLSGKNQEIHWPADDEIGSLVKAYNQKVRELELSAQKLAQSERQSAWREMAKQVAHEIKNPLTPMLLQVQQLERSWKDGREDFGERLKKFNQTMTEQIDTLSRIASEFSSFAKLPLPKKTELVLQDSIEKAANLFVGGEHFKLTWEMPEKPCVTFADKDHISRILNNLIKNATQAIPEDKEGEIEIELSSNSDGHIISITDNGIGILKEQLEQIFEPNFTTKSSGTGLGLAMVKSMIELADGSIEVVSKPNFGTTFILHLPLYKS